MDSVRKSSGRINTMENMIEQIREDLTKAGKRLHKQGLVVGNAGNISARIPKTDEFLIKPSGVSLEFLKPEELVVVNLQGNKVRGELPVSMEHPSTRQSTGLGNTRRRLCIHTLPRQQRSGLRKEKSFRYRLRCIGDSLKECPLFLLRDRDQKC
jgi:hypothetical protein